MRSFLLCGALFAACHDAHDSHRHASGANGSSHAVAAGCEGVEAALGSAHGHHGAGFSERHAETKRRLEALPEYEEWPCLLRLVRLEGAETRTLAVSLLVDRIRREEAASTRAWADRDPAVRAAVVLAWGRVPGHAHLARIEAALSDPAAVVREAALVSLRENRDRKAEVAQAVEPLLADPSATVRRQAVATLGVIGSQASCPRLAARLEDPDESVRERAAYALRNAHCPPRLSP